MSIHKAPSCKEKLLMFSLILEVSNNFRDIALFFNNEKNFQRTFYSKINNKCTSFFPPTQCIQLKASVSHIYLWLKVDFSLSFLNEVQNPEEISSYTAKSCWHLPNLKFGNLCGSEIAHETSKFTKLRHKNFKLSPLLPFLRFRDPHIVPIFLNSQNRRPKK